MVRVVDLRPRVRDLLESASWPCVGAQVKDGSYIVIWTACKRTLDQYECSCGFRSHPRKCLCVSGSIRNLSIWPNYQYKYSQTHIGMTERKNMGGFFKNHSLLSGIHFMQLCYIMYTYVVEALLSEQHYQLIDHLT